MSDPNVEKLRQEIDGLGEALTSSEEDAHTQFVQMQALKQQVQRLDALTRDLLAMVGEMKLGGKPQGKIEVKRVRGQSFVQEQLAAALTEGWEIISFNQYMEGPKDKKALTYDIWLKRFMPDDAPKPEPTPPTPPPIPPKHERPGHKDHVAEPVPSDTGDDDTPSAAITLIMPEDDSKPVEGTIVKTDFQRALDRARYQVPPYAAYFTPEERETMSRIKRDAQRRMFLDGVGVETIG